MNFPHFYGRFGKSLRFGKSPSYLWRKNSLQMKKWLILLFPLTIACNSQEKGANQTADNTETATPLSTAVSDAPAASEAPSIGGVSQELTIFAPEITAKSGEKVCVDVQVSGFEQLLSMQYTITWDKAVLQFTELKNFQLPFLDQNDFGLNHVQDGLITCAWIDESLKGATVADNGSIYQVCFTVKGKAGSSSYFKLTDRPTSIEVVNLREKIIPLKRKTGKVTVQ